MEHLVYASGKVTRPTFHLMKQVAFELERMRCFCHVVVACDDRISRAHEQTLRKMGLGILLVRQGVPAAPDEPEEMREVARREINSGTIERLAAGWVLAQLTIGSALSHERDEVT